MKQIERKVTITIELTEREFEALRLLSNRLRNKDEYIGSDDWTIAEIIGEGLENEIKGLFESEDK
jgi:hypothetical protein